MVVGRGFPSRRGEGVVVGFGLEVEEGWLLRSGEGRLRVVGRWGGFLLLLLLAV